MSVPKFQASQLDAQLVMGSALELDVRRRPSTVTRIQPKTAMILIIRQPCSLWEAGLFALTQRSLSRIGDHGGVISFGGQDLAIRGIYINNARPSSET